MAEDEEDRETTGAARVAVVALVGAMAEEEGKGDDADVGWEEVVGEVVGDEDDEEELGRKRRVGERAI